MRQELAWLWQRASDSWRHGEDFTHFGDAFAMLQSVGHNTQGQCFRAFDCLISAATVGEDAWQLWDLGNPAAIFFTIGLNL